MDKLEFYKFVRNFHESFGGNEFSTFCDCLHSFVMDGNFSELKANTMDFNEYLKNA